MKAIKKLMVVNGTYVDKQTQQQKTNWQRIGTLFQDGEKMKVKLDAMPVGASFDGWIQCFDLDGQKIAQDNNLPPSDFPNEKVPF